METNLHSKKDYFLVSIIGFLFGLLLLPVLKNLKLGFFEFNFINIAAVVAGFVIFANFALFAAFLFGRRIPVVLQFAKFGAVGALNTLLDLGILNFLIYLTGFFAGIHYSAFKSFSFIIANINAYFWNKYWTFQKTRTYADDTQTNAEKNLRGSALSPRESASFKEFSQFFIVSVIGLGINVGLASFVVNIIGPQGSVSAESWANIGALVATFASLIWNFIGYKLFVFKT